MRIELLCASIASFCVVIACLSVAFIDHKGLAGAVGFFGTLVFTVIGVKFYQRWREARREFHQDESPP